MKCQRFIWLNTASPSPPSPLKVRAEAAAERHRRAVAAAAGRGQRRRAREVRGGGHALLEGHGTGPRGGVSAPLQLLKSSIVVRTVLTLERYMSFFKHRVIPYVQ